jgi:chemotaxis protein MotB
MLGGCVSVDEYTRTKEHLNTEQQANAALGAEVDRLSAENARLAAQSRGYEDTIKGMNSKVTGTDTDIDKMKAELLKIWGPQGGSGEFDWIRSGRALGVRFDDSAVLFTSGSWVLTQNAKDKLSKLVNVMKPQLDKNPDAVVRVDGHTDADPIKNLEKKGIVDNTHLSTMRAMAVRTYLSEKGINKDRIFVAGFGEYWPVQAGKDARAKQANRRVEIFMGSPDALSIGNQSGSGAVVSRK